MAFDCFASHLVTSAPFRKFFIQQLREIPFQAYRWESPPVTTATMDRAFEFVAIDDSYLDRPASRAAFVDHLRHAPPATAITFPNLGADAILVVPTSNLSPALGHADAASPECGSYCHLGEFTNNASDEEQHRLWQLVGSTLLKRIDARPVWLSTAGDGVPWLHVRLDDYPKYYSYAPYREHSTDL